MESFIGLVGILAVALMVYVFVIYPLEQRKQIQTVKRRAPMAEPLEPARKPRLCIPVKPDPYKEYKDFRRVYATKHQRTSRTPEQSKSSVCN